MVAVWSLSSFASTALGSVQPTALMSDAHSLDHPEVKHD